MLNRLKYVPAILSALFFILTAMLWYRSNGVSDSFFFARPNGHYFSCGSGLQGVWIGWGSNWPAWAKYSTFESDTSWRHFTIIRDPYEWLRASFYEGTSVTWFSPDGRPSRGLDNDDVRGPDLAYHTIRLGDLHLLILFAILPLLTLRRLAWNGWLRYRRQSAGLCLLCGYDLRASRTRCPECGSQISGPTPS